MQAREVASAVDRRKLMRDFWSKWLQFGQYVAYLYTDESEPMWYGMQILKPVAADVMVETFDSRNGLDTERFQVVS